jgi:DNA-binding transcriptional LysR family regulator
VRKRSAQVDWDGLRYFRAVAAAGTLSGAARALRVEHTTVARRIAGLEGELGARLFLRNARGYVLTSIGTMVLESADAMDEHLDRAVRRARGQHLELEGAVRVATADALATHLVVPALASLRRQHPELRVEIVSDTRQHDLSRREADLALRLGASSDDRLIVKKLGRLGFGVYAARSQSQPVDERTASWVGFDETVGRQPHEEWLAMHVPDARIVLRSNRQHTLLEAVRRGLGLGILPCFIADADPDLMRLRAPDEVFRRDLAIHVHSDLQHSRRVRAFMNVLAEYVTANATQIAGEGVARNATEGRRPRRPSK